MADAPTLGPPSDAPNSDYDDGSGIPSGPAFHPGIPEEAFPIPTWNKRLDENYPADPRTDPRVFRKPDESDADPTMERMPRLPRQVRDT